jgi:hypothetical protein
LHSLIETSLFAAVRRPLLVFDPHRSLIGPDGKIVPRKAGVIAPRRNSGISPGFLNMNTGYFGLSIRAALRSSVVIDLAGIEVFEFVIHQQPTEPQRFNRLNGLAISVQTNRR